MDAARSRSADGKHAERVVVPQVGLRGEWKLREVVEALEIVRMDVCGIELGPMMRHVLVGVPQCPCQPFALPGAEFIARCQLVPVEIVGWGVSSASLRRGICSKGVSHIVFLNLIISLVD